VDVEAVHAVDAVFGLERDEVEVVERPQAAQVEHRAEVDEERVVALAGEHGDAVVERGHGVVGQLVVVGRRARADVVRWHGQVTRQHARFAARPDLAQFVGLADVEVRIVERSDRAGGIQEGVRVLNVGVELEAVGDVRPRVAVVVHMDLVAGVLVEVVEVRPAVRVLERDVVGDDRDGVGLIGADEGVQVGVVHRRVLADQRRFAVAGGLAGLRDGGERKGQQAGRRCSADEVLESHWYEFSS
jgi:hypothetical protein